MNKEKKDSSNFREEALKQVASPDELDLLFQLVTVRLRPAWLFMGLMALLLLAWLFLGSIPLSIQGTGIVLNQRGLFDIQSKENGVVEKILVKEGQKVKKGEPVLELKKGLKIESPDAGNIVEILAHPGSLFAAGTPLIRVEYAKDLAENLVVYAFIPAEFGKQANGGELVEIELSNIRASEYGSMVGKIEEVSQYPVSPEFIVNLVENKNLVPLLTQGNQVVVQLRIKPLLDPATPTGYKWTSGKGPDTIITTGTICTIKGISGHTSPLFYFFSLWRLEKLKQDLLHLTE